MGIPRALARSMAVFAVSILALSLGEAGSLRGPVVQRPAGLLHLRVTGLHQVAPLTGGRDLHLIGQVPGRAFHGRLTAVLEDRPGVIADVVAVVVHERLLEVLGAAAFWVPVRHVLVLPMGVDLVHGARAGELAAADHLAQLVYPLAEGPGAGHP